VTDRGAHRPGGGELRSNFAPGTTRWAVRRAQWRAMGISEEDMAKPKIAIVNSSSQLSVCYIHLDDVAREVADAVREAGGLPFEIRTVAPSDFVTSAGRSARYIMPSRDLIANDIEVAVEGAELDGMVCLASCDKTTPGQLMAAGRLDVPTTVVLCGYQGGGFCNGRPVDIDDVYESVGAVRAGSMSVDDLCAMTEEAVDGPGVCAGMGTANTMHILCEALGMALPGNAPVRAGSPAMHAFARAAGRRIVSLVAEGLRPRRIMTAAAFENAVMVDLAISGSVNSVRHLQAIALESGLDIDVHRLIERCMPSVPKLVGVRPNGVHRIEDLERAGGTQAVMARLAPLLHLDAMTVTGQPLGDVLASAAVADAEVVRPLEHPLSDRSGLAIIRGSLAPEGAIVKIGAVPDDRLRFSGPARVYESEDDAIAALGDGRMTVGDVVVLRGLGPKGGPGTVFAAGFVAALTGAGLAAEVAVVTDGELSGLNRGITIGQVMPEAALGGPLAMVEDGDRIDIDLRAHRVDLVVDEAELDARMARWAPPPPPTGRSWLTQYWHLVQPLSQGAVLGAPSTDRSPT
jgi:dihydroxy-acid dehydratase